MDSLYEKRKKKKENKFFCKNISIIRQTKNKKLLKNYKSLT